METDTGFSQLNAFAAELDQYDELIASQATPLKPGEQFRKSMGVLFWILLNIVTFCLPLAAYLMTAPIRSGKIPRLTEAEKQKAALIRRYRFSGDGRAIVDGLLFIQWKGERLAAGKKTPRTLYWLELWKAKAEELYERAGSLVQGRDMAAKAYESIVKNWRGARNQGKWKALVGALIIGVNLAAVNIAAGIGDISATRNREHVFEGEFNQDGDLIIKNYALSIPDYWTELGSHKGYCHFFAEAGEEIVILGIIYTGAMEYEVSLENLYRINGHLIETMSSAFDVCQFYKYQDFQSDYGVRGILYSYTFADEINGKECSGSGRCFAFPSEKDNQWLGINLMFTDDRDGHFLEDYMKTLTSVREYVR